MARPPKKAGAGLSIQTKLPGNQLQTICHDVAEVCKKMGSKISVVSQSPSQMMFSTTSMVGSVQNQFRVNILDRGEMRGMSSEITNYKVSQQRIMLIPVTPKKLVGFGTYKSFIEQVAAAVRTADPSAEVHIRES